MANKTVYPFGTDGQLPSSIGIVNDLTTGGADKALSAEMGKEIGETLFPEVGENVDLSTLTEHNYSPNAAGKWGVSAGKHKALPVIEGEKYTLTPTNGYGMYGLVTSSYTPPTSTTDNVPYVAGYSRTGVAQNTATTIIIPEGCAYIILVTKDGNGIKPNWSVVKKTTVNAFDAIDDEIETLQDEMSGLQEELDNFSKGFTPCSYIPIKESSASYMSLSAGSYGQGSAVYGDYFVRGYSVEGGKIQIYSLTDRTLVQTITLPTFPNTHYHANTISFGSAKYSEEDDFPILYICSNSTDTASSSTSEVYAVRISGARGNYVVTLVQTINIDFGIKNGWTEFVCDPINNRAWICGTGVKTFICVALPNISDAAVTIDANTAVIDSFDVNLPLKIGTSVKSSGQGMFFYHNRIYWASGVPYREEEGVDAAYVMVVNTLTHCIETVVSLKNYGLTEEPEGCFVWNEEFYVAYRTHLYKLMQ